MTSTSSYNLKALLALALAVCSVQARAVSFASLGDSNNDRDGTCTVDPSSRRDCGFLGSTQSSCEADGCCWSPSSVSDAPWCFFKSSGGVVDPTDPIPPTGPSEPTCPAGDSQKRDCGFVGITENSCVQSGCCWNPSTTANVPWCFFKTGGNAGGDVYVPPTKESWKKRSVYFVLTDRFAKSGNPNSDSRCTVLNDYCGGTFKGLEQNLDYIVDMGFDAIWITPVVANAAKGYHGYHATDLYEINPRLGSSDDLKNLVEAAHKKNIWIMLDVVANHMGDIPINQIKPFNQNEHYHSKCDINYDNQNSIENCRIAGLPDLNTENDYVINTLNNWVRDIVIKYKIDGLRIDTVKHIRKSFWPAFVNAAGVFTTGEIYNGDPAYVGDYTRTGGIDSAINFPMYYTLTDTFARQQSMQQIEERRRQNGNYKDYKNLLNFVDNHDVRRFLNVRNDQVLFKNALTYIMMSDGIPCVYYGSEQGFAGGDDPANRESLWPSFNKNHPIYVMLSQLNSLRHRLGDSFFNSPHVQVYTENNYHVFTRGSVIIVVNNLGSGKSLDKTIPVSLSTGNYADIFTGRQFTVNSNSFRFTVENGQPLVLVKN